ncbi:MAG: methylmalonyl-CoA epimerase [Acidobacteriia bacterium]|jgi:methylmalonyl-CoA/ethylmalonyl-CoA epimerase|nr:methylmalonyl-CoA epimerase [Terriglobia bacterium]
MIIDHIGIAVKSLENAAVKYHAGMGLKIEKPTIIKEHKVRMVMLPIGESKIELLEPTEKSSPISKFLDKRGEGVHHICFRVENIEKKIKALKKVGLEVLEEVSKSGYKGQKVVFLHPKSTNGVLIELVEEGIS